MTHIDLFSGIGGFAYAARQVWPDYRNLFFCDCNTFCQAVLRKNFGQDSLIYGDIREVTVERVIKDTIGSGRAYGKTQEEAAEVRGQRVAGAGDGNGVRDGAVIADTTQSRLLRKAQPQDNGADSEGWRGHDAANSHCNIDLLTGGFPCQPFSAAGKRKGRDDERHLWPEMYRVIKAFRPRCVIGENVRGLVNIENGMALQQVFLDLESIGYAVQAFIIPACAVNAPHRRDRIWIVAHAVRPGAGSVGREIADEGRGTGENRREGIRQADGAACSMRPAAADRHAANAARNVPRWRTGGNSPSGLRQYWQQPWLEVATRLCRVDDGLPAVMDGITISKSKHREERLKALGNAIVPQVAIEIMRAIKECE